MRPDFADDELQLGVRLLLQVLQQLDALVNRLLGLQLGLAAVVVLRWVEDDMVGLMRGEGSSTAMGGGGRCGVCVLGETPGRRADSFC